MWLKHGVIVGIGDHRDYYVKLPSGRVWWRNRRFLRPFIPPATPDELVQCPVMPSVQVPARRSSRSRQPPQRLNISCMAVKCYT